MGSGVASSLMQPGQKTKNKKVGRVTKSDFKKTLLYIFHFLAKLIPII
jgi:hypothetical protein